MPKHKDDLDPDFVPGKSRKTGYYANCSVYNELLDMKRKK